MRRSSGIEETDGLKLESVVVQAENEAVVAVSKELEASLREV